MKFLFQKGMDCPSGALLASTGSQTAPITAERSVGVSERWITSVHGMYSTLCPDFAPSGKFQEFKVPVQAENRR